MLVKLCDLLAKLYSSDEHSVAEALRIVRLLNTVTIDQIVDVIVRGQSTLRPVFYNPSTQVSPNVADEQHLKEIAHHVKQKTDLANNMRLIAKIGDGQLQTLARFIREEQEAIIGSDHPAQKRDYPNTKPFMQVVNWAQQRDLNSGK
jgi:hypothetical protein